MIIITIIIDILIRSFRLITSPSTLHPPRSLLHPLITLHTIKQNVLLEYLAIAFQNVFLDMTGSVLVQDVEAVAAELFFLATQGRLLAGFAD